MTKKMKAQEIRSTFLQYFQQHGHEKVESSSLIPSNDSTLLFTNAGMVQFKDVFLGNEVRPYSRATTAQRCLRAGGKHNDLENVGYTSRHHTFFEMLGNFSFGDYFKKEAIQFAWKFLTEILEIPAERLWVTIFHDDGESESLWLQEIKIDPKRFSKCGEKDNFWSMGDMGPCGPCTEIFYDHGPELQGSPPGFSGEEGDRFVEIWNLVFMQFNRDAQGNLSKLPRPCVDTGMGLERIATVLQGVHDNYDIDLFQSLLQALVELIPGADKIDKSMRVIVDHIRSVAFLIMDGVTPANEGRGYVLRRIIRRAIRHGYKLGQRTPFFYQLTPALVAAMGNAYPQLVHTQDLIEQVILDEENQFGSTLAKGIKIFDQKVEQLTDKLMPGELIFQLYDTYGFPPDLTADIVRERGLKMDYAGFEAAMVRQRQQSQQSSRFNVDYTEQLYVAGASEFIGYETLTSESTVSAVLYDNRPVSLLTAGQQGAVALNRTPFYAESGGQVGDAGYLYTDSGSFHVLDTQKLGAVILHYGKLLKGTLKSGDRVRAEVSAERQLSMLNHSATHLLHAALRKVLGKQVVQKGSLVEASRLRFDFSYPKSLTIEQIRTIESLVNKQIRANFKVEKEEMPLDEAQAVGAMALFDEKYGKRVRVIRMGDFSVEICGGTHLESTGQIGLFKIIHESAVAAGIRRLEAVTGDAALAWITKEEDLLRQLSTVLKSGCNEVVDKVHHVLEQNRLLNKEVAQLQQMLAHQQSQALINQITKVEGISVLAAKLLSVDQGALRHTLDYLRTLLNSYAIVLAAVKDGKVLLVAGISKDVLSYFNATELLNVVADRVGGRGGGRPDLAQGGGEHPAELSAALGRVVEWVKEKLIQ